MATNEHEEAMNDGDDGDPYDDADELGCRGSRGGTGTLVAFLLVVFLIKVGRDRQ